MENKRNPQGYDHSHDGYYESSSSSPTSFDHLFGPKDSSSSSSSALLGSIFPSPLKVPGRDSTPKESTHGPTSPEKRSKSNESSKAGEASNKDKNSGPYETETGEPCYMSSSIYYGGQENYSPTSSSRAPSMNTLDQSKKEDDPSTGNTSPEDSASRGDWWQGSLYY